MEIISILAWPIAVIIIVVIVILLLKKPIMQLIMGIKNVKYGEFGAEIHQNQAESLQKNLESQIKKINSNETLERALGIFSDYTIQQAKEVVENESRVNEINDSTGKINTMIKYSQAIYLLLTFERIYNSIFGSQIYLLEAVNTNANHSKEELKVFYDQAKSRFPYVYENYSYDDYLYFLISVGVISFVENNKCNITWAGRDFLKFLTETGKTVHKPH